MQDINPVRRTIPISQDKDPKDRDLRSTAGVDNTEVPVKDLELGAELVVSSNIAKSTPDLTERERVAFSSLYSPESRRNQMPKIDLDRNRDTTRNRSSASKNYKTSNRKIFVYSASTLVAISALIYTFLFASAVVEVKPVRTTVAVDQTVTIPAIDVQIASDVFTIIATSTASKDVPRRGAAKVETKSSGTVVIYNSFDASPQKLITNTRFESNTGKVYRIAQSVTVPGAKAGVPGSIEAIVFADSTGATYNAAEATFTIPGFKGTQRFTKFSAKTKTALTGGASGVQDAVADEDLKTISTVLQEEVKSKVAKEIERQKPTEDFIYLPDAIQYNITDNRAELSADPKLKYIATVSARAFYVRKDYLAKIILETTRYKDQGEFTLEDASQLVFGVPAGTTATNKEDIVFTVNGNPSFISKLDKVSIISTLAGTSKSNFEIKMKQFVGIEQAQPKIRPFWLTSFPKNTKDIEIKFVK